MSRVKEKVKKILPHWFTVIINIFASTLKPYKHECREEYWKKRAKSPGQTSVLWDNENYNLLVRKIQTKLLSPYLRKIKKGGLILDIGGGAGELTKIMLDLNPDVNIDIVDFKEYIEKIPCELVEDTRVSCIISSAEEYNSKKKYDMIVSSSCYSAIKEKENFSKAINNSVEMLKKNGLILMLDPFHKLKFLARARISAKDVIIFLEKLDCINIEKNGYLFWPFRIFLANSQMGNRKLEILFHKGEFLNKSFFPFFLGRPQIFSF